MFCGYLKEKKLLFRIGSSPFDVVVVVIVVVNVVAYRDEIFLRTAAEKASCIVTSATSGIDFGC